jgi:chaperone required for assembly of F1-ATPase
MKRFYKQAVVHSQADGHVVWLDERPIKTPVGHVLLLPTDKLAKAIAQEWREQGDTIIVGSMPLMQLAATTIDRVPLERELMLDRLLAYVGTDLLCHRVDEPKRLHELQERLFEPALVWLHRRYDIALHTTTELMAVIQPQSANQRLMQVLATLNHWELMGVQTAALASGSIVLALALHEQQFSAAEVFEAAEVESTYQIEKWGADSEIVKRRNGIEAELKAVERWFALLR